MSAVTNLPDLTADFGPQCLIRYLGGDLKDDSYMIGDYIAVSFPSPARIPHPASRILHLASSDPPYTLYPIYGAGGAELYYIGHTSDSVKLAVRVASR